MKITKNGLTKMKAYNFTHTVCPTIFLESGKRIQKSEWKIISPKLFSKYHLVFTRTQGEVIMVLKLFKRQDTKLEKIAEIQLFPDSSGAYYLSGIMLSALKSTNKNEIYLKGLDGYFSKYKIPSVLKLEKIKLIGEL